MDHTTLLQTRDYLERRVRRIRDDLAELDAGDVEGYEGEHQCLRDDLQDALAAVRGIQPLIEAIAIGDADPARRAAWAEAVLLHDQTWAGLPDFDDPLDRSLFVQVLEEVIRKRVENKIAEAFRGATERMRSRETR